MSMAADVFVELAVEEEEGVVEEAEDQTSDQEFVSGLQVKVTPHRPAPRRYPKKRLHSPLPAEMVVPLSLLAISTNEGSSGTNSSELQGQGSHWVMEALNSLPEEVEDPSSLEAYL
uniref:Uncharacterized protein n=1 Tax=Timema cristinae TaxID=61476 RepID=A0A7R9CKH7_TIMCR|nr:unnamed protein product [Timema cristinae]